MIKTIIPLFKSKTPSDKQFISSIKNILGITPKNISIYKQAFIHSSKSSKNSVANYNNERLEFLGDAVLGSIVGDYLFKKFPNKDEGFLTQLRSKIVNRQHLHNLAIKFGIDSLLLANLTKEDKIKTSAYGDAFEALIGAIYLDRGYEVTRKFVVSSILKYHVDVELLMNTETDFKSQLQIYCQKNKKELVYKVIAEEQKGAKKYFKVQILIDDKEYETFEHFSKKIAEQKAAELTFIKIKENNG